MKRFSQHLRWIIPLAILVIAGICFALGIEAGTLSGFGWRSISLLCPVGALSTMLAARALIPRALVSLAIAVVAILLLGRSFCGWVCPVPLAEWLRKAFSPRGGAAKAKKDDAEAADAVGAADAAESGAPAPLTAREKRMLKGCASCAERHGTFDSRHAVLGAGLLSAAIFGFPVVCLVCPIGLSFATVFLLVRAFGFGDPSWALIIIPAFLILEVLVFRKWCHWLCPVSALMSLIAKGNKTVLPTVDDAKCLETSRGVSCGACGRACPEGIDVRHADLGNHVSECTRCRACADACPGGAITFPFLAKRAKGQAEAALPEETPRAQ